MFTSKLVARLNQRSAFSLLNRQAMLFNSNAVAPQQQLFSIQFKNFSTAEKPKTLPLNQKPVKYGLCPVDGHELTEEEEKYRRDVLKQKRIMRRYLSLKRSNFYKKNEEKLDDKWYLDGFLSKIETVLDENKELLKNEEIQISSYFPINSEVKILPVIWKLLEDPKYSKWNHSLPIVINYEEPLSFREFKQGDKIVDSTIYKVFEPSNDAKQVYPQVLVIPLMGFMADCHRIGYGKGFYDRSIRQLREIYDDKILMIGVAFEAQKFDRFTGKLADQDIWQENQDSKISKMRAKFKNNSSIQWVQLDTDEALDYIVTEKKIYKKDDQKK